MSTKPPKIGHLITGPAFRDAIHIAVAPCIVGTSSLKPGESVCLIDGKAFNYFDEPKIGIVDPFLKEPVYEGESFWLFLFPDTITSLRHEWTHPAFEAETQPALDKAASRQWLEDFILHKDWPPLGTVITLFTNGHASRRDDDDEYDNDYSAHISDSEVSFSGEMGHGSLPPEFWTHLEIVTGRKFPHHPRHFRCSC